MRGRASKDPGHGTRLKSTVKLPRVMRVKNVIVYVEQFLSGCQFNSNSDNVFRVATRVVWELHIKCTTKTFCDLHVRTGEKVLMPAKSLARQVPGWPGQAFHPADWQCSLSRMCPHVPTEPQMAYHLLLARWLLSWSGVCSAQSYKKIYPQTVSMAGPVGSPWSAYGSFLLAHNTASAGVFAKGSLWLHQAEGCLCVTPEDCPAHTDSQKCLGVCVPLPQAVAFTSNWLVWEGVWKPSSLALRYDML